MRLRSFVLAQAFLAPVLVAQNVRLREIPRRMLPGEADQTWELVLGDVDGDGAVDLLVGNRSGFARTRLARNDGLGSFTDAGAVFPGDMDWTEGAALADVDGDGDLDVFLGKSKSAFVDPEDLGAAQNRLYLGQFQGSGSGTFADATAGLPARLDRTSSLALADLDGDGDVDALLGGDSVSPSLFVYVRGDRVLLGNGAGAFSDGPSLPGSTSSEGHLLAAADVDGDGDLDALYRKAAVDVLLRNDGTGAFSSVPGAVPALTNSGAFVLEDVDQDGDPDAFSGDRLYENDGTGLFSDASGGLPPTPSALTDVAMADVDGDGDLDALLGRATVYPTNHPNLLYLGDGAGGFSVAPLPPESADTRAVALADVDGDGDIDALLGNNGQDTLLLGRGDGTFLDLESQMTFPQRSGATGIAARDFDGDGRIDLFVARSGQNELHLGDGLGGFLDATAQLPLLDDPSTCAAAADVDGDGDLDVAVGVQDSPIADLSYLVRNDGQAGFSVDASAFPAFPDQVEDIALGDLDGDGDADALIVNAFSQPKRLLLNDGTGLFADASGNLPDAFHENEEAAACVDLNGDGALDLVVCAGGTARIYGNDGSGIFTQRRMMPCGKAVATGDVDLDGDQDLNLGLYIVEGNLGNFSFVHRNLTSFGDTVYCASLRDLDGDGDPDLLLGTGGAVDSGGVAPYNLPHCFRNGSVGSVGAFVLADSTLDPRPTEWVLALAIEDFDGDHDLDVLAAGRSYRLYSNLTRHLAVRALPRAGQPLRLELFGLPGQRWFLRGTREGPGKAVAIHGSGFLDAQGHATFALPVPDSTALVGQTLVWRARIDGRETNVVRTTFTDL